MYTLQSKIRDHGLDLLPPAGTPRMGYRAHHERRSRVRRKRGNRKLECSGCGRKFSDAYDCRERVVRDLPGASSRPPYTLRCIG